MCSHRVKLTASEEDGDFGFTLRPGVDADVASTDEDTPPVESIKGIKSIAKKRRQNRSGDSSTDNEKAAPKISGGKVSKSGKKAEG